ncbi:RagB/SusD family nutrient uptake outer membrane protein [Sphingobacterium kitahiroshimense]|uniref:RagB/SusD family nutrient uptake outer membrane protein n=1 Tax=Sphingobacterium kitahiroshimense TaxID=470446 RepID=A0ABV0BPN8_9SPHI
MKMNKFILSISVITVIFFCLGCNKYLDKLPDDQLREDEIFSRYDKVNQLVTDIYAKAKGANQPISWFYHFSSAAITDEAEGSSVEGNITNRYNTGDWSVNELPGDNGQFWNSLYDGIRRTNVVLQGVTKYNTPDDILEPGSLPMRIGEIYFMRAYFHLLLIRIYGEIPYVDHVITATENMNFEKQSFHTVVEKIVKDAEEAYKKVPEKWEGQNFGRIDKGACLGLIAQARWMAATPLWNGAATKGYTGTRKFESEYAAVSPDRWVKAKEAAKAVLNFTIAGGKRYSLFQKYSKTDFGDSGGQNTNKSTVPTRLWQMYYDMEAFKNEYVLFFTKYKGEGWFGDVYPPSRGGGSRQMPVQEQVDEYEYISPDGYGYPIYSEKAKSDGYDDANPYVSVARDPRFYRDIIFHGAAFRGGDNNPSQMNTAEGANRIGSNNATKTGYYLRKYLQEAWNRNGSVSISAPPVWRLPDFIYIYAEAVNQIDGPTQEIYDLINQVRSRSFMVPMPLATLSDKNLMDEYIKRERRVEFFYENKRAFDFRLYLEPSSSVEKAKKALFESAGATDTERSINYWKNNRSAYPKLQNMINGMRPIEDPNGKIEIGTKHYRMERFFVENRVFDAPKHYLFPILDPELQKSPTLGQNPGW